MAAVGQAGVALGRRADGESGGVEFALEGAACFVAAEGERGCHAVGQRRRLGLDGCFGRRDSTDRPDVFGRSGVGIARCIGGPHLEGVGAGGQAGVVLRAGAGGKGRAVEGALERRAVLVAAEGEGRAGGFGRVVRAAVDERVGRERVERRRAEGAGLVIGAAVGVNAPAIDATIGAQGAGEVAAGGQGDVGAVLVGCLAIVIAPPAIDAPVRLQSAVMVGAGRELRVRAGLVRVLAI